MLLLKACSLLSLLFPRLLRHLSLILRLLHCLHLRPSPRLLRHVTTGEMTLVAELVKCLVRCASEISHIPYPLRYSTVLLEEKTVYTALQVGMYHSHLLLHSHHLYSHRIPDVCDKAHSASH